MSSLILQSATFLFFLWWTIFELTDIQFSTNLLLQELISSAIKVITWIIPVLILLNKYNNFVWVPLNKMFINKFKIFPYIIVTACMIGYILIGDIIVNGSLRLTETINWNDLIGIFLIVGITEELVFRGWILNLLMRKTNTRNAILISSILFFFIHFPIWIKKGILVSVFTSDDFISVFVLGIIYSQCFLKSKNIMVSVLIHMLWNVTVFLFF